MKNNSKHEVIRITSYYMKLLVQVSTTVGYDAR